MNRLEVAAQIIDYAKKLYKDKYVVATDGNISARLSDKTILATPTGICKGELTTEFLVHLDEDGSVISGKFKPSSEMKMHLAAYKVRPDINAVVHAHPPVATAFACCGKALDTALVAEMVLSLGAIPLAPYGTPSTDEIPAAVTPYFKNHDGVLLANHGAVALGKDLRRAFFNMETIEHFARITRYASGAGDLKPLTRDQLGALTDLMKEKGMSNAAIDAGKLPRTLEDLQKERK